MIGPEGGFPRRGIHVLNGLLINSETAETLVGVIDLLALRCRPSPLSSGVVQIRKALVECCTYAKAYGSESAKVPMESELLAFSAEAFVDTATAAKRLGMTEAGVRDRCRKRRLVARQTSTGRWWIETGSIDEYAQRRADRNGTEMSL